MEAETILLASFIGNLAGLASALLLLFVVRSVGMAYRRVAWRLARRRFLKAAQYPGREEGR